MTEILCRTNPAIFSRICRACVAPFQATALDEWMATLKDHNEYTLAGFFLGREDNEGTRACALMAACVCAGLSATGMRSQISTAAHCAILSMIRRKCAQFLNLFPLFMAETVQNLLCLF
jgi:hypothetical protein